MLLKNGQGDLMVVGITIIKGDAASARWQAAFSQHFPRLIQRQHLKPLLEPGANLIKTLRVNVVREDLILPRQYPMKDQNRQAPTRCTRAKQLETQTHEIHKRARKVKVLG
nr:hypothetical protein [uncultured Roseateles sp.]